MRNLSIKSKLNLLVLTASGVALLFASVALIINDAGLIRSSKLEQLSALAKVIGANSTAALTFDDAAAAREILSSLSIHGTVQFACLYDAKGRVFATYGQVKSGGAVPPAGKTGYEFTSAGHLNLTQEIISNGDKLGTLYLRASLEDLSARLRRSVALVAVVMLVALGVAILLSSGLQRVVSGPILELAKTAETISADRDYSIRVHKHANDELGTLYNQFNGMLDQIERGEKELQEAHVELEDRVRQRTQELSETNQELTKEVAERRRTEEELEVVHKQLVNAAHRAGMAEVATGVLHNVGNVLNSVNVSANLVADRLRRSRVGDLNRALGLMNGHVDDLATFLAKDNKGQQLRSFLHLVASHLTQDNGALVEEMQSLNKNIDHVKTIIAMQQSYAHAGGLVEKVALTELFEDVLKMNTSSFAKHGIEVTRQFYGIGPVQIEKQKVLQILVNLVMNARDSLAASPPGERRLTVRILPGGSSQEPKILLEVADNGVGIAEENLTRIFSHGFTTKAGGHGFGLHSSANAARELGGAICVRSDGPGCGAVFTLEIPLTRKEVPQ